MIDFIRLGCGVSMPYGDGEHYDFIADVDGKLLKVQCKTAQLGPDGESIDIDFRMIRKSTGGQRIVALYKATDIDYFATWYQGQTYLIPVTVGGTRKRLRFSPPPDRRYKASYAEDYELEKVVEEIRRGNE